MFGKERGPLAPLLHRLPVPAYQPPPPLFLTGCRWRLTIRRTPSGVRLADPLPASPAGAGKE